MEIVEPGYTLGFDDAEEQTQLSFSGLYERDNRLRSGSFGTVYTCHHQLHTDITYAVKILDRRKLKPKDDAAVFREISILKLLKDLPHVVRLIDFFVEPQTFYMVQVYAAGGDVFDRLAARSHYTEKDARDLAKILLRTIEAIHEKTIVHRDLKPENLLLKSATEDTSILLADFGFARTVPEKGCITRCGTPAFVAPEILLGLPYNTSVDLWSIGCLLYMLIGGYPPFQGANHRALFRKVRASDFIFHEAYFQTVSVSAKQLISGLLTVNSSVRWTATKALACDWFHKTPADRLLKNDLSGNLEELQKFKPRQTWKSTAKAVAWASSAAFWNPDVISFSQQLTAWDKTALGEDVKAANRDQTGMNSSSHSAQSAPNASTGSVTSKVGRVKFLDVYELKTKLRKGSYATVWECQHMETKEILAAKIIQRKGLQPKDDEAVLNEVAIMQSLTGNKYTVQLMDFYEEDETFYLVMEYMAGGDVFDNIVKMTSYTEKDARDLTVKLLKAVSSIHKAGIAHRDIKPQNLLLSSKENNANIKIGDFGFARRVHTPESLTTRVGTPTYVAPEILKNIPHDQRADLWSIGVVIFVLLVGYPPFLEEKQSDLFAKIRAGDWKFVETDWAHISLDAKALIKGLLVTDPKERWSLEESLRCRWIQQDPNQLSSVTLCDSMVSLKQRRNRLRSLARAFMFLGKETKPVEVVTQAQDIASKEATPASSPQASEASLTTLKAAAAVKLPTTPPKAEKEKATKPATPPRTIQETAKTLSPTKPTSPPRTPPRMTIFGAKTTPSRPTPSKKLKPGTS
jgi:calcium/calmodulin-dependent protein kinase I